MRVDKDVYISECVEVQIDLTIEDVCSIYLEDPEAFWPMLMQLSRIGTFLNTLPEQFLQEMNDEHKKIVTGCFEKFIDKLQTLKGGD